MKTRRLLWGLSGLAAIGMAAGLALAQVYPAVPKVVQVDPTDLFLDIVHGSPTTVSQYATAAQIAGVPGYTYVVATDAFVATVANGTSLYFMNPAGTLSTGTLTFMPNPGDGQRFCLISTQTQSAITPTANTGQTISAVAIGAVTALTANVPVCWFYRATNSTWYRYV